LQVGDGESLGRALKSLEGDRARPAPVSQLERWPLAEPEQTPAVPSALGLRFLSEAERGPTGIDPEPLRAGTRMTHAESGSDKIVRRRTHSGTGARPAA